MSRVVLSGQEGPLCDSKDCCLRGATWRRPPRPPLPLLQASWWSRPPRPPPGRSRDRRALPRGGLLGGGAAGTQGWTEPGLPQLFSWTPGLRTRCRAPPADCSGPPPASPRSACRPRRATAAHLPTGLTRRPRPAKWSRRRSRPPSRQVGTRHTGRAGRGLAQHGRLAGARRPDGWGAKAPGELGRGAAPAPRALPSGAPTPKRLVTPRRNSGRRRGLLPRWQLGVIGRGDAPRSPRGAQTLGSWDRFLCSPRGFSGSLSEGVGGEGENLKMHWLSLSPSHQRGSKKFSLL